MGNLFLTVVNMSITAGFAALIILLVRGSLGRALPRTFSCALWLIVLFRMVLPFSFPSVFSALRQIKPGIDLYTSTLRGTSIKEALDFEALSGHRAQELANISHLPGEAQGNGGGGLTAMTAAAPFGPMDYFSIALTALWLAGILALLIYHGITYFRLCRTMSTATFLEDSELAEECRLAARLGRRVRVYVSDRAESPFVYGLLSPKVILPAAMAHVCDAEGRERLRHVLLHEFCHIKRGDWLTRPLAFLALCVHWFNPVLWVAFRFAGRDMEMACDEGVIKALRPNEKEDYAATLLTLAAAPIGIGRGSVLAFHGTEAGERVRHIVKYKKPKLAAAVLSGILVLICGVTLLSNPVSLAAGPEAGETNLLVMCGAENSQVPDTFLLLGYDKDSGGLNVAFLPRDLVVAETAEEAGGSQKLSRYAGENPPEAVTDRLGELLGIDVHHYVRLDTGVLRDLVDAAGGVEFDVPMRMLYKDPLQNLSIDLQEGRQVLDGTKAEMLLRYRKGYVDGDLGRISVQREFLKAALAQKSKLDLSAGEVYQMLSHRIETDLDLKGATSWISLAQKLGSSDGGVNFIELPVTVNPVPPYELNLTPEAGEQVKAYFD